MNNRIKTSGDIILKKNIRKIKKSGVSKNGIKSYKKTFNIRNFCIR